MANIDINLVPEEERSARNLEQLRSKLTLFSTIFLAITAVFTMATLAFFLSLAQERSKLLGEVNALSQKIDSLKAVEELLVVTKGKASAAVKILDQRTNYSSFFEQLSTLIPQNVYFSDMRFTGGKLVISGKSRTSADMAGFVSALVSEKGSKLVSNVTIDSLNSDETGIYTFVVSLPLIKPTATD